GSRERLYRKQHRAALSIVPIGRSSTQKGRKDLRVWNEAAQSEERLSAADAQYQRHSERHNRSDEIDLRIEQREQQLRKQQHEHEIAREEPERLDALHFQRENRRDGA